MAIKFNADEIFEMAIQAESNAYKMYSDLAKKHVDPEVSAELMKMAEMEKSHENIFIKMRKELPEDMRTATFDPNEDATLYLQTIADAEVGEGSPEIAKSMTGRESFEDVLKMAIGLEKQAILFYLGIRDMVPERLGKDKVEHVIKEEQSHVVLLTNRLKSLK